MEKKKVQANTEDVIKALASYLYHLNMEDSALRGSNKRLNIPIDRFKDLHLWDAKKMVFEYFKIQQKASNYPSEIRHWITSLVLHIIKQVEDRANQVNSDNPKTPDNPNNPDSPENKDKA